MAPQLVTPTHSNGTITLVSGPLDNFMQYSRLEASQWLIDIAHDICDPALMRGSLQIRNSNQWSPVTPTDPLVAAVYLYTLPAGVIVELSKISQRKNKSSTSAAGNAGTMEGRVKARDVVCWATGAEEPLMNSHICPKRMGDVLAREIYGTFAPVSPVIPNLSVYDEVFGITLSRTLDAYFNTYTLGLRAVGPNAYKCHLFVDAPPDRVRTYTIAGRFDTPMAALVPAIHGLDASPPHPAKVNNPPPGLLRWHYLQCVLRKFMHTDYKALPGISYLELPLRTDEDSDEEGKDSESD
ncbi:hypothetical protein C8R46DRAFT_912915 [Mycena filopes]|nr:hypothetical protein C8R46DRAFT_912915 [Mycena filopes]